ncbi:MAG: aminopeptidase P family N-terminal domain-containing protein [Trueperaceae bacterium]|nr:aminopeptidase P family N-terminal domain-containing protein [Trueperaceae bacterium]
MRKSPVGERLDRLRSALATRGIDAWLATTGDAHLSEYIGERWRTRAWLSGFRGSAGRLVVTQDVAGLWVDSRYHQRADADTQGTPITVFKEGRPGTPELAAWLATNLPAGSVIGFDPETLSMEAFAEYQARLSPAGLEPRPAHGLIDEVWLDRPEEATSPLFTHPPEYAGETAESKLARLRTCIAAAGADVALLTTLDEIAWLLNVRGNDVPLNPVALAFCLVGMDSVRLYVHMHRVDEALGAALPAEVELSDYGTIAEGLAGLPVTTALLLDPGKVSVALGHAARHVRLVPHPSPVAHLKAVKNPTELAGAAAAHLQDGIALTRLLHWLSECDLAAESEAGVARKLEEFRAGLPEYRGPSFETIVAFGPHSSEGHYRTDAGDRQPLGDGLLLIDCGSHFPYGTTDTTRTVALGDPTAEQRRTYTLVLKSVIGLSSARFPKGTVGKQLNALARAPLWRAGLDCPHGIGHGVGSYLHVHEGPQRIHPRNEEPFGPGMVNSCEPAVYFEGRFGVRLENVIVTSPDEANAFGEFYRFETLTLCPFDPALIETGMLTSDETEWLNEYHARVERSLSPHLTEPERAWLREKTAPL